MKRLTAVIITRNEEANIERCLQSLSFADEIVIVDSHSEDRTVEIASRHNAVILTTDWIGFGPAKQKGVTAATGEWVLSIDADEEVSPGLAREIKAVTTDSEALDGYYIPRRTQFLGRWIGHCGWYPDYILRLFRRSAGRFDDAMVHEKVVVAGATGRLKSDLWHYSYPSLEAYFEKSNRYTSLGADEAYKAGKKSGWFHITIKPIASFLSHYLVRQGFRDGLEGFLISILSSGAVLVKYAKLRDRIRKEKQNGK